MECEDNNSFGKGKLETLKYLFSHFTIFNFAFDPPTSAKIPPVIR